MVEGGCVCGAVRVKSTGEIKAKALCHCLDCRKTTGSIFSTNIIVAGDGFSLIKGTPKQFAKTAKSGKTITSFFCGDCGSTIWRETETYGDSKIIKVGTMDGDALEDAKPAAELFVGNRPSWLPPIAGAQQNEAA
ncbi:glutathione-dependent formaldehyde-activating [Diaporthe amygdali]|uniref:glutathione-dependent formaldehyde-activating n=1 Tax=Phomopsis amygdali TaxID=1214568 RepID=UPI0022FDF857|nr:glutathione-dependent formaldehyde-activating [Diaporthe amygdali]KAJ0108070.1 glutathione-dependent formaldehyde-activating [Diaporthe amygdali]